MSGAAWVDVLTPREPELRYCGKGICAALEAHEGTCDEASGWASSPISPDLLRTLSRLAEQAKAFREQGDQR